MQSLPRDAIAELTAIRHALHRHPDVSGREGATAERITADLRARGADRIWQGLGGHGVAAEFRGSDGRADRAAALRTRRSADPRDRRPALPLGDRRAGPPVRPRRAHGDAAGRGPPVGAASGAGPGGPAVPARRGNRRRGRGGDRRSALARPAPRFRLRLAQRARAPPWPDRSAPRAGQLRLARDAGPAARPKLSCRRARGRSVAGGGHGRAHGGAAGPVAVCHRRGRLRAGHADPCPPGRADLRHRPRRR